jgi:hypothetical protein
MADRREPLRWFARKMREAGQLEAVPIGLERNREAAVELGAQNPPDMPLYRFKLGLRAGFSGDLSARVPVFRKTNPHPHPVLKEVFYCEVAGSVLEAANVHALQRKVAELVQTLAPGGSLPLAYFRVSAADYSLPAYEQDGEIVCPLIGGPKLKAPDLAGMRRHVCRRLINAGYVSDPSQVELLVVRPSDLRLVEPAAVIRSLADPDLWMAAVEGRSAEGLVIGLLGEATELRRERRRRAAGPSEESPPAASDVASLLRLVGNQLAEAGNAIDPFCLHATQVRPEIWARTEELTDALDRELVCWLEADEPVRLALALRRTAAGELVAALEHEGISVFVALDERTLADRVGRYLSERGFLRWQDAVEVGAPEPAARPQPEWAAGEIEFPRTEFGSVRDFSSQPEEVNTQ